MDKLLTKQLIVWLPEPGPQVEAYLSEADEIYFGGQAGGGKTDLLLGLAMTAHKISIVFRREYTQFTGAKSIVERSREILSGTGARYNGQTHVWRSIPGNRRLEFGSCPHERSKENYKGRPHDFKGFDEVPEFSESQYLFLSGWLRSTDLNQRCRIICTGNPPTSKEGMWVIKRWAPWLDSRHPNPAEPGELRWFAVLDGEDQEVDGPEPFDWLGETIFPRSRTFIPAALEDNPYLRDTDYRSVLQSMPEPLRSQLLYGDFSVQVSDEPFQVIPTTWVLEAERRWTPDRPALLLQQVGIDVARGGRDETVLSPRFGWWFDEQIVKPGKETPDGPTVAGLVLELLLRHPDCEPLLAIDLIAVGSSAYDSLRGFPNVVDYYDEIPASENGERYIRLWGFDARKSAEDVIRGKRTPRKDRSGMMTFYNVRSEAWWNMREALDPSNGYDVALPPDPQLRGDLTAPTWKPTPRGILVEAKENVETRLQRSTDRGDAAVMAQANPPIIQKWGDQKFLAV